MLLHRVPSLFFALLLPVVAPASEQPERKAFFGDLHIHTMYSLDAFMRNVRTSPDDAYAYARGATIPHPDGSMIRLSGPPLDFLAVTDHASMMGVHASFLNPDSPNYDHPDRSFFVSTYPTERSYQKGRNRLREIIGAAPAIADPAVVRDAWRRIVEAANRHNDPGAFTAFIGYEYTPSPATRHLHRNVIFRGDSAPDRPFSRLDSMDPEDLWDWLEVWRANGIDGLAIPHNMNQSDGLAFPMERWRGGPIDRAFAEKRMRNEPIVEMTQLKGTSETHPSLSPNDEWADFQIVQYYLNKVDNTEPISVFKGGYLRDALRTGLELESTAGFNPHRFGVIGSSDSHASGGSYDEAEYFSKSPNTPQSRGSAHPLELGSWNGFYTPREATHGPGGLAGVWAEENTREALFDAMRRKETFATSGPRIRVRLFASFDFPVDLADRANLFVEAYRTGVAMGGALPRQAGNGAPRFLVWAARDPRSGWLDRAQIVKGWVEAGESKERVFDVACSDGNTPEVNSHRCPPNSAEVDLTDCSVSRNKGNVSFSAVWADPTFDPDQHAFYYLRVLENPSCRWSTWDAIGVGIEPNPELQATQQDRAWSSPIWYRP